LLSEFVLGGDDKDLRGGISLRRISGRRAALTRVEKIRICDYLTKVANDPDFLVNFKKVYNKMPLQGVRFWATQWRDTNDLTNRDCSEVKQRVLDHALSCNP
jgi:hypothetical protein